MGLITYGKITKRHGLSGEVKVLPFSKNFENLINLKQVYIELPYKNKPLKYQINNLKIQKNTAIMKLEGIDTPEDAEKLKNCNLLINENDLANLDENEYYWYKLIGLKVYTNKNKFAGEVTNLIDNTAYELLVIESEGREYFIPFVEKFILEVDMENSKIIIDPIEGLLD